VYCKDSVLMITRGSCSFNIVAWSDCVGLSELGGCCESPLWQVVSAASVRFLSGRLWRRWFIICGRVGVTERPCQGVGARRSAGVPCLLRAPGVLQIAASLWCGVVLCIAFILCRV